MDSFFMEFKDAASRVHLINISTICRIMKTDANWRISLLNGDVLDIDKAQVDKLREKLPGLSTKAGMQN